MRFDVAERTRVYNIKIIMERFHHRRATDEHNNIIIYYYTVK